MVVNVEIKCLPWEPDADTPDRFVVHAVTEIARAGCATERRDVIVSSFDLGAVDACRAFAPEFATAGSRSGQDVADGRADRGRARAPLAASRPRGRRSRADAAELAAAQRSGLRVNVWTVDDPDEITPLAAAGVDAIITNVPDVALGDVCTALTERRR